MDDIRTKLKKKLKNPFRGSRRGTERVGAEASGERVGPSNSLPRPEPHVGAGGGDNREGSGANAGGRQVRSIDQPQPESIPADGGDGDQQRGETDVIVPSDDLDTATDPGHVPEVPHSDESAPSITAEEKKSNWKSTAYYTARLLLLGVSESASAFGPLKSVAGGLCFILENCEHTMANRRAIESLAPRVKALSESLCAPVSEGDANERERRKTLEQKLEKVLRELGPLAEQGRLVGFFNNVKNADKLGSLVEDIREAVMDYQTSLQRDIYDKSCQLIGDVDRILLNGMHHIADAGHRSGNRQGCLGGTRTDVLLQLEDWLKDEHGQRVFWLNGLAGTGKSTIAQTFAEIAFAEGKLGAGFFCSRDFEGRSNLQAIFPTLAFQLAYQYPPFREQLLQVLRASPDIGRESLCSQLEKAIVGPFKTTHIRTLIIIDALDECKDEEPASAILSVLSRCVDEIPDVKFFITGRPEPRIRSGFRLKSLRPITEVLRLHDVERSSVDSDIKLFFRTRLTDIAKTRSDCNFAENWPDSSAIDILCEKAGGFFIYASTVVKFVASKSVFNPLSVRALSDLLKVPNISTTLRSLHSLLLVPDSEKMADPIRPFHKSFPDFLTDPKRCKDKRFFVKPGVHHTEILLSCLNLMRERLKENICNLDDYAILSEVKDLSVRRKDHIGDALEYACQFWTKHLLEIPGSSPHIEEVHKAINRFFTTHLLCWIEVLALTGNLGIGAHAINDVEQWCDLVYHSVLPLSPSSSWLCKYYSPELSKEVRVIKGLPAEWGICSRTVLFSYYPMTISCWNYTIAVGFQSPSGDITILSIITGSQIAVLSGHTDTVRSVTFSPDGLSLVSGGDDKTVKLWDVQTGGAIKTFYGHTRLVWSVSISANSAMIASGSEDRTICLWDVKTGGCHHIIKQQDFVGQVSFSPIDPQCLISVSGAKVWQWDINGHQIGSAYNGSYIAFSSDGSQIALYYEDTVTVQNSKSRVVVAEFHVATSYARHCCLSPDGKFAAAAANNIIYVWDIASSDPYLVQTFIGHTYPITSLAFSSPSSLISTSYDNSVKFWQISTSTDPVITDPKSTSPTSAIIKSVTLQSKYGIAITSDSNGVVRTWDISTGLCKEYFQTPAKVFHNRDVQLIDGRLIFVWHANNKIHIWDVEKGEHLFIVDGFAHHLEDLRISGDGSKVFYLDAGFIQAYSIQTGEVVGKWEVVDKLTEAEHSPSLGSLTVDGSRIWVYFPHTGYQGWDFEILGSLPVQLDNVLPTKPHPNGTMLLDTSLSRLKNAVTGKIAFQLSGRFSNPVDVQYDGQYLVAGYSCGEVLILDFNHVHLS
ncbi:WD40 repeat-like protein [Thelephora ganbajun]|uniref:WD40 repeat-like protein n=1 Tax=Thelephora ganbajun TaxID=370292 RepID=A0ACB6Z7R8_THEGA|nr:WD40 repeat-like protein [Thelephora ganbajun]